MHMSMHSLSLPHPSMKPSEFRVIEDCVGVGELHQQYSIGKDEREGLERIDAEEEATEEEERGSSTTMDISNCKS